MTAERKVFLYINRLTIVPIQPIENIIRKKHIEITFYLEKMYLSTTTVWYRLKLDIV